MAKEKKVDYWIIATAVCIVIICVLIILLYNSVNNFKQCDTQYNDCKKEEYRLNALLDDKDKTIQELEKQDSACQELLKETSDKFVACSGELRQFKSSTDYYYSIRAQLEDPVIKTAAINAKKEFGNKPACKREATQDYCVRWELYPGASVHTYCAEWATETYCAEEDADINYYFQVIGSLPPQDDGMLNYKIQTAISNYVWVRDNIYYSLGYAGLDSQDAKQTLALKAGKCDEMSTLLMGMLMSTGIDARIVILPAPNHAIVAISLGPDTEYLPGKKVYDKGQQWILVDPTCKYCTFGTLPDWDLEGLTFLEYYSNVN